MIRLFEQHEVRVQKELDGMWRYLREDGESYMLPVPGCVEQHPKLLNYRGKGSFYRKIYCREKTNLRLEFKGVSHTADVFFDGHFLMHHYNAYTGFCGIVKDVEAGPHEIRVDVDNSFSEASALHVPNDYYTYGGITRPVVLEQIGDVYIRSVHFTARRKEDGWHGVTEVELENLSPEDRRIEVWVDLLEPETRRSLPAAAEAEDAGQTEPDPTALETESVTSGIGRTIVAEAGQVRTVRLAAVYPDAKEWSPENPRLYDLKTSLSLAGEILARETLAGEALAGEAGEEETAESADKGVCRTLKSGAAASNAAFDDLIERVAFRSVSWSEGRLWINGRPVFLKGFNRHEDYGAFGCAIPIQLMAQDLDLMQEAGANAVRTCHYPNDERFLDLCDERGILVWEENHARGLDLKRMCNPNFDRQCADCIEEMIAQHYNHPSIVIWGILNECASDTEIGREKYKRQYEQIRSLDASRPVTSATCKHFTDICLELPDIVSFNIYSGWYQDVPVKERHEQEMRWIREAGGAGKPVIVSEFGAGAVYGYRDRGHCKWSEERQADVIHENLEVYREDRRLTGVFLWQFADCRVTEEEWFQNRARCHNNKGVVDEFRRPKEAFDTVKEMYLSMGEGK